MSDYSEYNYYSEEEQEGQEENFSESEQNTKIIEKEEKQSSRIQFQNQTSVTLHVGSTADVMINPGPAKSFQIVINVKDGDLSNQLVLNICDGQCNVSSQQAIVSQTITPPIIEAQKPKISLDQVYAGLYSKVE
ncbi:Conserved_hypothetical protein [Hexamita inflata]|uniref:Uncharacterized protein n=1 Tax=Hexamita inflata TaxID=28002 RepID=A0AA86RAZ6_9EUKA|nr:Conserved hypothetical protein [Hexamita inflata]